MAAMMTITGVSKVLRNLKKSKRVTGASVERGLVEGGHFLQRESMLIVPIDKDILRTSARTIKASGSGFTADIVVRYKTDYAVFVHEDLTARHKPGKRAKYLEEPARTHRIKIIKIVNEEARRKI